VPNKEIAKQLNEERAVFDLRRKEREEQHLYLHVGVITEDNFKAYQGFDLTSWDTDSDSEATPRMHRVLRTSTLADFSKILAESQRLPPEQLRLWVMVNRQNKTIRPDQPLLDPEMTVDAAYTKHGSRDKHFRLWVETASAFEDGKPVWPDLLPHNKTDPPILVFLKYFDSDAQKLTGVGHIYIKKHSKVSDMVPMITQVMGWSHGSPGLANGLTNGASSPPVLALYEEIKSSMIEPMKPKSTLLQAEIQDGDIVCFQKSLSEKQAAAVSQSGGYTDAREFYDYLLNKKTVTFLPKSVTENDEESFKLDLSRKMVYEQFSAKVGEYLKVDPTHLRFSTVSSTTNKSKQPIKRNPNQNLFQILSPQFGQYGNNNQRDDALYYEILDMSLSELDTKKSLKLVWVTEGISKEELLDILVPKTGHIRDLILGLQKKANLDDETTQNVRVYDVHNGKVNREFHDDSPVSHITDFSNLYAEIIPEEERNTQDGDAAIFCYHFDKEPNKHHGIPFKFVVKPVSLGRYSLGIWAD